MAFASISKFIYGPTPEEKVKRWQSELKRESRLIDREIRNIESAVSKTKSQLKGLASKNDIKNCKILAKEVVRSNKQKDRHLTSKARLNSINMQLSHQLATLKITGNLQKSTEIMKLSNELVRLPQLQASMRNMSMEMTKAGIMSEMVDETFEMMDDENEELDDEAEAEVDKVLFDITNGKLGDANANGKMGTLPTAEQEEEEDPEIMRKQLDALLQG